MRRVLDFPLSRHTWSVSLLVQRCPTIASVPSSRPYATQSETPKESVLPCPRELTGENSPLYTYQPTKKKTDRVLAKYFSTGTRICSEGSEGGHTLRAGTAIFYNRRLA
jgi:hypothetical protein